LEQHKLDIEEKQKKIEQMKNKHLDAESEVKKAQNHLDNFKSQFGGNLDNFMKIRTDLETQIDILKRELRVKQVDFEGFAKETDEKLKEWRILKHENENQAIEIEELNKKVNFANELTKKSAKTQRKS